MQRRQWQVGVQARLHIAEAEQRRVDAVDPRGRWRGGQQGIEQYLRGRRRRAAIAQGQAQRRRQVAAGAVAGHQQASPIQRFVQLAQAQRLPGTQAILQCRRERMLRRQSVIHRQHQQAQARRQVGADEIV